MFKTPKKISKYFSFLKSETTTEVYSPCGSYYSPECCDCLFKNDNNPCNQRFSTNENQRFYTNLPFSSTSPIFTGFPYLALSASNTSNVPISTATFRTDFGGSFKGFLHSLL